MKQLFTLFLNCLLIFTTSFHAKGQASVGMPDSVCNSINCNSLMAENEMNGTNRATLYPNPTVNDLNIIYDTNQDIKNIAVYNIIGKIMAIYKVSGNSANLNLQNLPSGIYFVRLVNSRGDPVVTRKFTKQ